MIKNLKHDYGIVLHQEGSTTLLQMVTMMDLVGTWLWIMLGIFLWYRHLRNAVAEIKQIKI